MNRLSRMVVLSSLMLSAYSSASFAADYFFLKDLPSGATVQGINTPGVIVIPAEVFGTEDDFTFSIPTAVTSQVFLLKPGTKGLPDECLDQGDQNRVGYGSNASGGQLLIQSSPSGYTLTLSVDASATASNCSNGNPAPVRVATVSGSGVDWTGTYDVYAPNSVPEPGSLALLGLGLGALVFAKRRKVENP